MYYLIGKILLCLIIAALFGFLLGWLLRGMLCRKEREDSDARHQSAEPPFIRKDDLKQISGIGFVLEERLNHLGIYTFEQIAAWKENDIRKISAGIGPFRDRILRDDWIGQARKKCGL